ncbi:hypothetical protein [Bradyrhizobium valentinum]|uniref:Cucumopine synthase C-terminal helical bundle domain-containing protein n=1 Tax=Bradyrhizobium valentinum TaxID=1518501 RepID=A0A0R3M2U5_9BRAD|nr:hypothetical protein [Bradyrhizobium valentinum]KRR11398.1 hypothetical protein CP49_34425 [Bradyrhizobium valentinum]
MAFESLRQVVRAVIEETNIIRTVEPEEVYKMRTGSMDNKAGTNGQYFTTWDFANGMIRDMSMHTWYHFVELAENENVPLDQLYYIINLFDHPYSNYLRYSGFPRLGSLALALRQHLPSATSRKEAVDAVRAFCAYTNLLSAWCFHYFPWGLGTQEFSYESSIGPSPILPDKSRRIQIRDGRKIKLTWEGLGVTVNALLAVKENPELCDDIINALPFTILQDHAVIGGKSMYGWAPVVSTAPVHVKERQCDAPPGRIRFSQGTGNKFIVQYGEATEDIAMPVLGEVPSDDIDRLGAVGLHVLKSTFETKELIWLKVELA